MQEDRVAALRARIAGLQAVRAVGRVHSVDGTTVWVRGNDPWIDSPWA